MGRCNRQFQKNKVDPKIDLVFLVILLPVVRRVRFIQRGDGLHQSDNAAMFKRAERNPIVVRMMAEYGEERCHELLHVSYTSNQ